MNLDNHLLIFVISTTVVLLTPGPTNTLLTTAGLGQGSRAALPLIAFELAGYLMAISLWGVLLTSMLSYYPWLSTSVRIVCSCYLFYVGARMWRGTHKAPVSLPGAVTGSTVFMTTLLNPKGLLFASTTFPPHAFDSMQVYLTTIALFACLVVPIGSAWITLGAVVGSRHLVCLGTVKPHRILALVICLFSVSIAMTTVH
jgi:threonine/homoserine/homoserine lactone efflux protein